MREVFVGSENVDFIVFGAENAVYWCFYGAKVVQNVAKVVPNDAKFVQYDAKVVQNGAKLVHSLQSLVFR